MLKNQSVMLLTALIMLVSAFSLSAHPHNWINVSSHFIVNNQHELTEIKQSWEFDEFYSMITYADLKNEHTNEQIGLALMADQMRNNLAAYSYFSHLLVEGKQIQIPKADHALLTIESHPPVTIMTLTLEFKFKKPIPITGKEITWSVFDPTYYIAMNHQSVNDIIIEKSEGLECGKELVLPTPTAETIAYAGSLDKSQRETDGLGSEFAERVVVTCI